MFIALLAAVHLADQRTPDQITFLSYLPNGTEFIAAYCPYRGQGGWPGHVEVRNAQTGKRIREVTREKVPDVLGGALAADGKTVVLGGRDLGDVQVRDTATGKLLRTFKSELASYPDYALIPNSSHLALIESSRVSEYGSLHASLCDLPDGEPRKLIGSEGAFEVVADPKGRWLAAITCEAVVSNQDFVPPKNYRVRIYEAAGGNLVHSIALPKGVAVRGSAFSPDGRRFALRRPDGSVQLYATKTWEPSRVMAAPPSGMGFVDHGMLEFSPDGRKLIKLEGNIAVTIFDLESKRSPVVLTPDGHAFWRSLSVAPDGRHFLLGTMIGTIELRSLETGKRLKQWTVTGSHETIGERSPRPVGTYLEPGKSSTSA